MRLIHIVILALLAPAVSTAGEALLSETLSVCIDAADGDNSANRRCVIAETELQDRKLNANYKRLGSLLSPTRKTQLLDAQRLWIKYVDANYQLLEAPEGGLMARLDAANWVMHATAERARELDNMASALE